MRRWILIAAVALAGCGSSATTCDATGCAMGSQCVSSGRCATSCDGLDGGGCPAGTACGATGPFCKSGENCPAIAFFACLFPDGG